MLNDLGAENKGVNMDVVCSWCGKKIGRKDGKGVKGTTSGICESCLVKNFPHIAQIVLGNRKVKLEGVIML